MSTSGRLAISYNKTKLKNDVYMKFFHREQARLKAYLIQVKLVYSLNLKKYSIKINKIMIITTYLKEDTQF